MTPHKLQYIIFSFFFRFIKVFIIKNIENIIGITMAAPKGNQYAKGNPNSGRPLKYDMEQEAIAIEEWSKKESAINLVGFVCERDICPDYIYDWADRSEVFSQALKKAKARLAERRERLMNQNAINYGSFNRYQDIYDPFLKRHEDEKKNYEAYLKKAEEKSTQEITIKVDYSGNNTQI